MCFRDSGMVSVDVIWGIRVRIKEVGLDFVVFCNLVMDFYFILWVMDVGKIRVSFFFSIFLNYKKERKCF